MPLIIAITGKSDTGKTSLTKRLIPKMKRRGYKVATVRNCPHGFDLDVEGKDSWHFTKAGAEGILLQSPSKLGLIRSKNNIAGSLNEVNEKLVWRVISGSASAYLAYASFAFTMIYIMPHIPPMKHCAHW